MKILSEEKLDIKPRKILFRNCEFSGESSNHQDIDYDDDGNEDVLESELILDGMPTGIILKGVVLEAAISWKDFYVVFLTDDILHEDMLHIYYLDKNLNLLDSMTLGAMYSTGAFSSLKIVDDSKVSFEFIGGNPWELEFQDKPSFRLPILSEPRGVQRKFGFRKYFCISGDPLPGL